MLSTGTQVFLFNENEQGNVKCQWISTDYSDVLIKYVGQIKQTHTHIHNNNYY